MTEWRACPAPFSRYEASRDGRIRNDRGHEMSVKMSRDGVPRLTLWCDDKKERATSPQRLVWMAFNGPIPSSTCVLFRDGDGSNMALSNLDVATRAEFNAHRARLRWKREDDLMDEYESELDEWIFGGVESEAERKARLAR